MARILIEQTIDDIDGATLDEFETVRWSLDGREYEFDTSPENAEKFRLAVSKYVDVSRKSGQTAARRTPVPSQIVRSREQTQAIRDWANQNGHEVSRRGPIPLNVVAAFDEAH